MTDVCSEGSKKDVIGYYIDQFLYCLILVFIYMWMV